MLKNLTDFKKTISFITVLMIVSAYFLPVSVYAANEIAQNADTQEKNVKFDAKVNNTYNAQLFIGEEANLEISAGVENAGYLKDAKVTLEGNNYALQKVENENIKGMTDHEIQLNEIEEDQQVNIIIPMAFIKEETETASKFNKESKVKFEAVYVNAEGNEKKIEKELNEQVKWDAKSIVEIKQDIVRYIKYEDKTLVTFEISEGIKDNAIPVVNKEISVMAPTINGQTPVKTIVSGNNINYDTENGVTNIKKIVPTTTDGKYSWNSQDKYLITYIYSTQTNLNNLTTSATAIATDINNKKIEGKTINNEIEVQGELGSLVEVLTDATPEINKGYMYTNTKGNENKLDTIYTTNYKINVGFADVIDRINAYESDVYFANENGEPIKNANDSIKVSKVKISRDQVIDVLGENGTVTIKDEQGNMLAKLNKDNTEKDINAKRVIVETTKPIKEGTIEVALLKAVTGEGNNTKEEVANFKQLVTVLKNEGYNANTLVSNAQTSSNTKLTEPTSKASIDMNTDRLSTVVENENISFNVVLNKTNISDALYSNPTIRIKFPEEITKIAVKSARVLYEDEIQAGSLEVNDREIVLKLQGVQTQYNKATTTAGTLIKIDASLGLNMLAPSNKKDIVLEVTNEFTGETIKMNKGIDIIAPSGFVTTNTINIDGQNVTALENDVQPIKVRALQNAKTMEISANIVNNLETSANGLVILGRIPTEGNKTIGGEELGTSITTKLISTVETTGLDDANIYYSENIDEPVNGAGWTNQATEKSKSFKIEKQTPLADKTGATFKYKVEVPEGLDYEKQARENFGIFYNNDSEEGVKTNLVESKVVGIMTGAAPAIKSEITAFDTNEGYAIDNNGTVTEGEYITYRVKVSNTGSYDAHNVKVVATIPESLSIVNHEVGKATGDKRGYFLDTVTKTVSHTIETLAGGESKTIELNTEVTQLLQDATEETKNISVYSTINADILEEEVQTKHTSKNTEGNLNIKLSSYQEAFEFIEPNTDIVYELKITNPNITPKTNARVNLKLPEGVKFDSVLSSKTSNYDERENIVSIDLGTINAVDTVLVSVKAHNESNSETILKTNATVYADGIDDGIVSNTVELRNEVANQSIQAVQTSNLKESISDTDELQFYIDLANNSNLEKTIEFIDEIDNELRVDNYNITVDGITVARGEGNYITERITIPGNKSAKITIITDPYTQKEGTITNIENIPVITSENGVDIEVNPITVAIEGTERVNNVIVEKGNKENATPVIEEQKHKITGEVWLDSNKDGRKQNEEERIAGVELKLYNSKTNEIVADSNGNEVIAVTDTNGVYVFSNIDSGEYVVMANYDNTEYETTSYRENNLSDSENSDFVSTDYNGEMVAVTDVIKLTDNSQYNIDLGIVKRLIFDLGITKTISKISISNSEEGTKLYDVNNNKVRVELSSKALENSTILVEYDIQITNNGDVAGYAKSIVDYLPKGMNFSSELNKDWYLSRDGNLYNVSIANKKLNPGESENIKLVLTRKITNGDIGIVRGKSAIETTYNELGLQDISAKSELQINTDEDIATADVIITKSQQGKVIWAIGISFGVIALVGVAIYEIKKHLDKKYYVDSDI